MSARAEQVTVPAALRWLAVPVLGWTVVASLLDAIRRRARKPTVPPMSEQWLRQYDVEHPWE